MCLSILMLLNNHARQFIRNLPSLVLRILKDNLNPGGWELSLFPPCLLVLFFLLLFGGNQISLMHLFWKLCCLFSLFFYSSWILYVFLSYSFFFCFPGSLSCFVVLYELVSILSPFVSLMFFLVLVIPLVISICFDNYESIYCWCYLPW